jgi:hypothetical protein
MIGPIAIVDSVERIRDGGSLAAVFRTSDGAHYWLFLQIRHDLTPGQPPAFEEPALVDRTTGLSTVLTWAQAASYLAQIGRMVDCEEHLTWLHAMTEVVERKGSGRAL